MDHDELRSHLEDTADELPDFDKMWNYSKPKDTESKFRELLPQAESSGQLSYHIQLLTQLARTQSLQRKFAEAHQILDGAKEMLDPALHLAQIRLWLERGRTYNSAGEKKEARRLFLRAWDLAVEKNESFYAVDAAHMMAIVEPLEKQESWNVKALEVAENSTDPKTRKWLGSLYNNMGWTYFDSAEYDRALNLFEKSLKWNMEWGSSKSQRVAKWCLAKTMRMLGRVDEALAQQKIILQGLELQQDEPDGFIYEELAECYHTKGEDQKARRYFSLAHRYLSRDPWLMKNESDRIERLKSMAAGKGESDEYSVPEE